MWDREKPRCGGTNQHALAQSPCNQPASHHCSHTRTASLPNAHSHENRPVHTSHHDFSDSSVRCPPQCCLVGWGLICHCVGLSWFDLVSHACAALVLAVVFCWGHDIRRSCSCLLLAPIFLAAGCIASSREPPDVLCFLHPTCAVADARLGLARCPIGFSCDQGKVRHGTCDAVHHDDAEGGRMLADNWSGVDMRVDSPSQQPSAP